MLSLMPCDVVCGFQFGLRNNRPNHQVGTTLGQLLEEREGQEIRIGNCPKHVEKSALSLMVHQGEACFSKVIPSRNVYMS
jgi:hypothetical protein